MSWKNEKSKLRFNMDDKGKDILHIVARKYIGIGDFEVDHVDELDDGTKRHYIVVKGGF